MLKNKLPRVERTSFTVLSPVKARSFLLIWFFRRKGR